jgi:hypothetical protein
MATHSAASAPRLPRLQTGSPDEVVGAWNEMCRVIEDEFARLRNPAGQAGYTVTNRTSLRTLDATSATLTQATQVLGNLVLDLQKKGQIG